MSLQITYQDKATQTDLHNENTIEKILNTMTLLCTKLDTMDKELQQIKSQQHDAKHAQLSPSNDSKIPELEGDDGKHRKTQTNSLLHAATGAATTSATKEENKIRYANANMAKLFDKPFIPKTQKDIFISPQINTYKETPAEILYDEIKPIIQVIKIGLTREMIIPEKIEKQNEIQKIEIPEFYVRKRVIGLATILNELATNYLSGNAVWSYYAREQTMIYSNCRETRPADMEEIRQWVLSLLKPEQKPTTRAI
ncbi:hypothetical protein H5410_014773 [Solanum commersonii]|uniref:Uncharacterized protein n=1 Tax=Solanum commersonii TaxID=4109 RepID=A0A9J5ZRT5_SOLCO|nr:hypothetical protein H5410_014773 [Solanum commersonii]